MTPQQKQVTAFVLSGGGNRGALQVGALRALAECGLRPDMLVGVSAGALNAVFIATLGWNRRTIDRLAQLWESTRKQDVYPGGRLSMTWRAMRGQPSLFPNDRFKSFLARSLARGRKVFGDLSGPRAFVVAARLPDGALHVFGDNRTDPLLDALLASTAVPPFHPPCKVNGTWLVDGAIATGLPVVVAIDRGATQVCALQVVSGPHAWSPGDLFGTAQRALSVMLARQSNLETTRLHREGGQLITLTGFDHLPIWDFNHTADMIEAGYQQTRQQLYEREDRHWHPRPSSWLPASLGRLVRGPRTFLRGYPG